MRDRGLVIAGLLVFLALITLPLWLGAVKRSTSKPPELKLPENEKACVLPTEEMREKHMDLLITWRDEVVRQNKRTFTMADGRVFEKSLTKTCLHCHTSKADFCDKCHDYASVKPYCWDCHIDPKLVARS
jgi:hypothetical protein